MPTLKLTSLQCLKRHDVTGDDEPALYVDGARVWNGVMDKGETEPLTGSETDPYPFSGSISVRLEEISGGIGKPIGLTHTVTSHTTNKGKAVFKTSGTHYELEYKVTA